MTERPPSYDLSQVDQVAFEDRPDLRPTEASGRRALARMLAMDATIYGLPSVYQYAQLYDQAVVRSSPGWTGFNVFRHQRDLATPDFTVFKTPNVDTLYSNAWLDLTNGPARVSIPAMGDRYYTLQFLDMYANATNLSSRTVGPDGGNFLIAAPSWSGNVPDGVRCFRVATPYMWILMRILVRDDSQDVDVVRALQDAVTIDASGEIGQRSFPAAPASAVEGDWRVFFTALDAVIRANGTPSREDGLVYRYRHIGIGGPDALDLTSLYDDTLEAMQTGFADAMGILAGSRSQVGEPVGDTGWVTGTAGQCGFNYLRRALQNFVGTGGNVLAEKKFYAAFTSADGAPLDGSFADYRLRFDRPPPVAGHWSVTVYPVSTGLLYPNELERYAISATTPGLHIGADGGLQIHVSHRPPPDTTNWLPAPDEPFYLDIRTWHPEPEVRDGRWQPGAIERLPTPASDLARPDRDVANTATGRHLAQSESPS